MGSARTHYLLSQPTLNTVVTGSRQKSMSPRVGSLLPRFRLIPKLLARISPRRTTKYLCIVSTQLVLLGNTGTGLKHVLNVKTQRLVSCAPEITDQVVLSAGWLN